MDVKASKPVLVFGYPWYRDCHGVFMVKDADSCKEALDAIARGYQVDQQKVINTVWLLLDILRDEIENLVDKEDLS